MAFNTALTGLNGATADLGTIAHNIANNNTTGFKASRAEFSELFPNNFGTSNLTVGSGVQLAAVTQQFQQGSISSTGNPLDLAVNGEGFFRLNNNGDILYTRAGAFQMNRDGYIVNNIGQRLTGYELNAQGELSQVLGDLRVPTEDMDPNLTTQVVYGLNLDAEAPAIDTTANPFDIADPDSYNYTTSVTVYDSLGISHSLTAYFVKPDAAANDWEMHFTLDGGVPFDTSTTPPTPTVYGPEALSFDQNGIMAAGSGIINLTGLVTGNAAADLDLELDFTDSTQFGSPFSVNSLVQDGYTSGSLTGIEFTTEGVLSGRYNNGQTQILGRVALANFANPQGLTPVTDTNWMESFASGAALVGAPGTGRFGIIRPSSLEDSNVDLTDQLVKMIEAQRNFQANAQVLNTSDTMTQTLLNR